LALTAIIDFIPDMDNPLDGRTATRTGLAKSTMDSHSFWKGRDLCGESTFQLASDLVNPMLQGIPRRFIEISDFHRSQSLTEGNWGEFSAMEDLVRIGIPDSTQDTGVRERAFQRVIPPGQALAEGLKIGSEDIDASRIVGA
jgi:hypothetical protein